MTNDEAIALAHMTTHIWDRLMQNGERTIISPRDVAENIVKLRRAGTTGRKLCAMLCDVPNCQDEVEGKLATLNLRIKKLCKKLGVTLKEIQSDPRGSYMTILTTDHREYQL